MTLIGVRVSRIATGSFLWMAGLALTAPARAAEADQPEASVSPAMPLESSAPAVPTVEVQVSIPEGTLVALRIEQNLSSQTSRRGDTFAITLMNDLRAGDRIVLPVGTKGIGEVIHSAGKGFGGRAGELIVTARYLEYEGKRIALRGFKLAVAGADNAIAAVITTAVVPIAGVFVTGSSATISLGQLAQAKLAAPFQVSAIPSAAVENAPLTVQIEGDQ